MDSSRQAERLGWGALLKSFTRFGLKNRCRRTICWNFAEVSRRVRIPIATGERLATKAEFGTLLRTGGASILQPALGRVGGILEAKKIAGMAEAFNAQMAPHLYAGPVEWAASIQLAATLPNLLIVETIQTGGEFHLALINNTIKWENGYIRNARRARSRN